MGSLLRYEFRRILRSKYLYICTGISLFLIILITVLTKILSDMFSSGVPNVSNGILAMKGAMGTGYFTILGAIIVAMFISEEYGQETIKNVYSKGFSRVRVFFATYLVSLIAAFGLFILQLLFGFLFGTIMYGGVGDLGEGFVFSMLGLLLIMIAYHAFFFGISISLRKSGPAIALVVAGPLLLAGVVSIVDALVFKDSSFKLGDFWLSGRESAMGAAKVTIEEFGKTIASALVTAAIFLVASFFINKKRES